MSTPTNACPHVNYDDYFDKCEDCGYEPETCWQCTEPLRSNAEIVGPGGIFCSEGCHEEFTAGPRFHSLVAEVLEDYNE